MIVHVFIEFDEMYKVFAFGTLSIREVIIHGVVGSSFSSWVNVLSGPFGRRVMVSGSSRYLLLFFSLQCEGKFQVLVFCCKI